MKQYVDDNIQTNGSIRVKTERDGKFPTRGVCVCVMKKGKNQKLVFIF